MTVGAMDTVVTNNFRTKLVGSNSLAIAAAHRLIASNLTPSMIMQVGLDNSLMVGDLSGDVTTSGNMATTLKNTGTAGTYTKVTFDAAGRETSGTTLSAGDIPAIAESGVTSLVSDLAAKQATISVNYPLSISGATVSDAALTNLEARAVTLANTLGGTNTGAAAAGVYLFTNGFKDVIYYFGGTNTPGITNGYFNATNKIQIDVPGTVCAACMNSNGSWYFAVGMTNAGNVQAATLNTTGAINALTTTNSQNMVANSFSGLTPALNGGATATDITNAAFWAKSGHVRLTGMGGIVSTNTGGGGGANTYTALIVGSGSAGFEIQLGSKNMSVLRADGTGLMDFDISGNVSKEPLSSSSSIGATTTITATNGFYVPTNAQAGVAFDFSKPGELIITNASFVINTAINTLAGLLNKGELVVSNSSGSDIQLTMGTGWRVEKAQGLNQSSTMVITNSSVAHAYLSVWPNICSNILFFPSQ